jgi:hypothetical protein
MLEMNVKSLSTAVLFAMIAGPAAATEYIAQISGTLISGTGVQSMFADGSLVPQANPAQYGQTATTWQVGTSASPAHGGTASSNVDLAPINPSSSNGYAQSLLAQSTVFYYITLSGSANDPLVPVDIKALGSISWTQYGAATAGFRFQDYTNSSNLQMLNPNINQNDTLDRQAGNDTFSVDSTVELRPSDTYVVTVYTNASADARNIFSANYAEVSAFVDPTFTVVGDYASRWTISGVPFATSAVPEPSTWAMMMLGFAGIGCMAYRRRKMSFRFA